ncbi:MAG: glycosyl hydrolase [Pleurocapsa sp. MO_192.B19]|nr:glycosyl hydrolase [Pleurocapsa sp. MO_192.B19]
MIDLGQILKKIGLVLALATVVLGMVAFQHHSIVVARETSRVADPILLGIYPPSFMGDRQTLTKEVIQIGQWAGKRFSLVGSFINIETHNPAYDIPVSLELLRTNGYTGFINLTSTRTMAEIVSGKADRGLVKIARAYANWSSQGTNRLALIAPFPEMNGAWESYGEDPVNFKLAYQRVRNIFKQAGVKPDTVRWVFAPNGWSPDRHKFEYYYPGDNFVDVVAFSGYNWGYCSNAAWKHWSQPQEVYQPYIQRLQKLAPHKPIFIAQTATTSYTPAGSQFGVKNRWLRDTYTYLASEPQVKGIIYFNIDKECDWQLFNSKKERFTGYIKAIVDPAFGYLSPADLARIKLELQE